MSCATPAGSRPRRTPLECLSNNEAAHVFLCSFNGLSLTHSLAEQTGKTHTAALTALRKVWPWDVKRLPTKAPPLWAREMREDGMEVNALRVNSDCSFLLVN